MQYNNIVKFFFALALVLISATAMPATDSTTTATMGLDPGEIINVEGTLHIVQFNRQNDVGGRQEIKTKLSTHAKGAGQISGVRYVVNGSSQYNQTEDFTGAPAELTFVDHLTLIGQGGVPNEGIKAIIHETVNANGDVTATKFEASSECQG